MLTEKPEQQDDEPIVISINYEKLYRMKAEVLNRVVETGKKYIDALFVDLQKHNTDLKISDEVDPALSEYREAYKDLKDFQEMVKMAEIEVEAQHAIKH